MKATTRTTPRSRMAALGAWVLALHLGLVPTVAANVWIKTGSLNTAAGVSSGILLHDNTVLVVAGDPSGPDTSETYDPNTGQWREIGPIGPPAANGRVGSSAVLLRNGLVLVVGGDYDGSGPSASCRLYDPASGTWFRAGSLNEARSYHTVTLLDDGRVLAVGGLDPASQPKKSAELYDPGTDMWAVTDSLETERYRHTANFLAGSDEVLVAGGITVGPANTDTAEVFDVGTETWSATGAMTLARNSHSATRLQTGLVLVAGGDNTEGAELYNPGTGAWAPTGSLPEARWEHSATLLPSGLVLVAGGRNGSGTLQTAFTYSHVTGQFTAAADLTTQRFGHSSTMMPDGRVLVSGGWNGGGPLMEAELYDQDVPVWIAGATMTESRTEHLTVLLKDGRVLALGGVGSNTSEYSDAVAANWTAIAPAMSEIRLRGTATLLNDGRVLAAGTAAGVGDAKSTELFDPGSNTWSDGPPMQEDRYRHTASLLACGEVLVAGGERAAGLTLDTAERYDPVTNTWRSTGKLTVGRWRHTATTLPDGRVLVTGGWNGIVLSSAEIYDPATETWSLTAGSMSVGRYHHQAVLLPSGQVLILAGSFSNDTAEIFDPATELFTPLTRNLITGRSNGFTTTLLQNGRVLIVGGFPTGTKAELFDPAAPNDPDKFVPYPDPVGGGRNEHSAVLLQDGRVLVTGGGDVDTVILDPGWRLLSSARPVVGAFTNPLVEGSPLAVNGAFFEGWGEGSSGFGPQSASTSYPLVRLQHLDSGVVKWPLADPGTSWTATTFRSVPVTGCLPGPTRATVFVNGVSSVSDIIMMECSPPSITTDPVDADVCVGGSVSFTVASTGQCPGYAWRKDLAFLSEGGPFSGTSTAMLDITGASVGEIGSYDAVVGLGCSSSTDVSGAATLAVHGTLSSVAATLSSGSDTVCPSCVGGTIDESHLDGGPVTYEWGYRTVMLGAITTIPGQTGPSYVLNGSDLPGPGSYFIVVTTTPLCGAAQTSNEVPVTVTTGAPAGDVPSFTVTSRDSENVLEWVYPGGTLDVRIRFTSGATCVPPTDPVSSGTFLDDVSGSVLGQKDRYLHGGLTNGLSYCYTIFAGAGPWSPGRSNSGRPMDTALAVKWSFNTGVFSLTAPTVGGAGVIATSNEPVIHAMERGLGGGEWPVPWYPVPVDGAVQSRSPIVPVTAGGANPVAYVATQAGSVFVIDGVSGGSTYPWAPLSPGMPTIQAAPAGMFTAFTGTYDYLLVGSRVPAVDNEMYVVDPLGGGLLHTFDNGGGAAAIGMINGMASVDYANDRLYFASFERGGAALDTLWCLDLQPTIPGPPLAHAWSRALGSIHSSPVLNFGTVYVGSPNAGGTLYAIRADTGAMVDDRTFPHGDGQVKGFVFPDRASGDLYFATDTQVWALNDNGSTITSKFPGPIILPAGAVPTSAVLFVPGSHYLYVGADDGRLYEIDVSGPLPSVKFQVLGDGLAAVGSPSLDFPNNLIHVGTEAGVFYAVETPLP